MAVMKKTVSAVALAAATALPASASSDHSEFDKAMDRAGAAAEQPSPKMGGLIDRLDGGRYSVSPDTSIGLGPGSTSIPRRPGDGGGAGFTPGLNIRFGGGSWGAGGSSGDPRAQQYPM